MTGWVLVKEDPTEPSCTEVGLSEGGEMARGSECLSGERYATETATAAVPNPFLQEDLQGLVGCTRGWLAELKDAPMCSAGALEDPELAGLVWGVESGVTWCLGEREHRCEGCEDRLRQPVAVAPVVEHGEVSPGVKTPSPQQAKGLLPPVRRDAEGQWEGMRRVAEALL